MVRISISYFCNARYSRLYISSVFFLHWPMLSLDLSERSPCLYIMYNNIFVDNTTAVLSVVVLYADSKRR